MGAGAAVALLPRPLPRPSTTSSALIKALKLPVQCPDMVFIVGIAPVFLTFL